MIDKKTKSIYNKTYYNKHKTKILSNLKQKVVCKCGTSVSKSNLNTHQKTAKHFKLLRQQLQTTFPK